MNAGLRNPLSRRFAVCIGLMLGTPMAASASAETDRPESRFSAEEMKQICETYGLQEYDVCGGTRNALADAKAFDEAPLPDETSALEGAASAATAFRNNERWTLKPGVTPEKNEQWAGKVMTMTAGSIRKRAITCLFSSGCYVFPKQTKTPQGKPTTAYGWHCGARKHGPVGKYLTPVDYSCYLHDRGKYGACGLEHSLRCSSILASQSSSRVDIETIKSVASINARFIGIQNESQKCPKTKSALLSCTK